MPTLRRDLSNERGFTLVEVTVALSVLLIGVLGTVMMIDTANSTTSRTKAREGATALARSVLEIGRGIPYRELTADRLVEELAGRSGMDDARPGTPGHQISSRGFVYTVTPTVCATDDPTDNLGSRDSGVAFCANSDALGAGQAAVDRNSDDYRRIVVSLGWQSGTKSESVVQTSVVTNPVGGLGPSVTSLTPDTPATTEIVTGTTTSASYRLVTSAVPASVTWSVDGARLGTATGSGTSWSFNWPLGTADAPQFVDCAYVVQAEAFDASGRAGAAKALTVTLNRRVPFAPTHFSGGRNLNGSRVDVEWQQNAECDVKRYRVYRGTAPGSIATEVCAPTKAQPTQCVDEAAPSGVPLYYQVVAVDTPPGSTGEREGDRSAVLTVPAESANDEQPTTPGGLTLCTGGNPGCNDIDGEPAPSGVPVLTWEPSSDPDGIAFYRVYRDGVSYANRLDVLFEVPGKPLVFIDATANGPHTYRVSAVDGMFGESPLSGAVSWQ